ncbi:MAG: ABC transporter substrate-binding protein [Proteobacteria bacterium]|nr:ABC transporter substrate-binding protein [Pseudomonadota bacterium]
MSDQNVPTRQQASEQAGHRGTVRAVRIGAFSSDPAACDAFHGMDPECGIVYAAINDSLVYIDSEGVVQPGLATAWRRIDPLTMEFDLREGVCFHNDDRFTAADVVATIRAQLDPKNRAPNGQGILSVIRDCTAINDYKVRLTTHVPDGMLLYRLHIASAVYPESIIESKGVHYFHQHPIGTGGYVFERWTRGQEIVLSRNPDHWSGLIDIDELRFPIIDQKDWVDALLSRQLDIALNLDPHDAVRIMDSESLVMRRREAAISHWFVFKHEGPLADRRVRLALNYAVHRHLLCNIANHGWASPQTSLLTPGQVGYDREIPPYPYDPDYAVQLLDEAGYSDGFTLRGLVSESSCSVYQLIRVFLERINVRLEAEIVPRPTWLHQIVTMRLMEGKPFDGDFALTNADNFTLHGLFHHSAFLFSKGICSLLESPQYDQRFIDAATKVDTQDMEAAVRALDRYAHDEALMLFTIRQQVYCCMRKGYDIPISISGHFNFDNLWRIRVDDSESEGEGEPNQTRVEPEQPELQRLLDATTYPGILYNPEPKPYEEPVLGALWRNIELQEIRWKIQADEMLRTLVEQVTSATNLDNVLRSTQQVAILGITHTGRVLFVNSGYRNVMGHDSDVPLDQILFDDDNQLAWQRAARATDEQGMFTGVFNVPVSGEAVRRVFLTATPAINENRSVVGYVCIFTDHSKEEERLRIRQEMEVAQRIQVAMLPDIEADQHETLAATMIPAEEVGGDYYDVITDDNGYVWYAIGDVSGHGVTSGLVMLMTHSVVRTLIRTDPDASMDSILTSLNRVLCEDIDHLGEHYHVTFAVLKSLGNGDYLAAGAHEDAVVYRQATGQCELIPMPGVWLGLMPDIAGMSEETHFHLDPGDTLVLYTDGVIEATAADGSMWGSEALVASIQRHADLSPNAMKEAILQEVRAFMDQQFDDITILIIRRPSAN